MIDWTELVDNISPSTAGFSREGGKAVSSIWVADADIEAALVEILGDVARAEDGSGRLQRNLPKAHPRYPWLFARNIPNIVGRKFTGKVEVSDTLEAPSLGAYASYDRSLITIEFASVKHAVLPDGSIPSESFYYYADDDSGSGDGVFYDVPMEWLRFTDYDYNPRQELITAQMGFSQFRRGDGSAPATPRPHLETFAGRPRMVIPSAEIKFRWLNVPFSYIEHPEAWIVKGIGRVNQRDWYGWPAGSLLYLGVNNTRYTPIVPEMQMGEDALAFSMEKVADIEFSFAYTKRAATAAPTPANRSWIAAGHNLQPWLRDRKFYYTCTQSDAATEQVPTYLSFPFQFLFVDPEAF